MSQQSSRKASITRSVLKEIINNEPTAPSTKRTPDPLELIKLNEAITFLERKIERQYKEIKMLSDQLSNEISLKEEITVLLAEEKDKCAKASQHLSNANKQNAELKKKLLSLEKTDQGESSIKDSYEIKLNKYRDIVRKKDEMLTKNQQKLEEMLVLSKKTLDTDHELKRLKESFERLKHREEHQTVQLETLKKKSKDLEAQLSQKQELLLSQQQSLMFAEEAIRRLRAEYDELSQESSRQIEELKESNQELRNIISLQSKEITQRSKPCFSKRAPEWSLAVFSNEIKRGLLSCVKDATLRKKVQRLVLDVVGEMEVSFNSILRQVLDA